MARYKNLNLYGEFEKFDSAEDGSLIVSGIASSEVEDSQGEVVTADAMREALGEYLAKGSVREMHQPSAVGRPLSAFVDESGETHFTAHIVDKDAIEKIKAKVYKGFSIAGKALEKVGNKITKLLLKTIDVVDIPSNPKAYFTVVKFDKPGDHCTDPECKNHHEAAVEKCSMCKSKDAEVEKMKKCGECGQGMSKCDCKKKDEDIHKDFDSESDHKSKYGDVEYADEELHKYPIDTKAHIRAAWSYINMPKNQHGASSNRISHIKSKIRAAAERHGIKISDDTEKIMSAEALQKLDSLTETVTKLAATVETLSKSGGNTEIAKLQASIDDLNKRQKESADAVLVQEKRTIISKMESEGRIAFNETGTAYKPDELEKMDLPMLKFAARNSTVLPTEARAIYKGTADRDKENKFVGKDGKPLTGSSLIEKAWEGRYGILEKLLQTPIGQSPLN